MPKLYPLSLFLFFSFLILFSGKYSKIKCTILSLVFLIKNTIPILYCLSFILFLCFPFSYSYYYSQENIAK